MKLQHSTKLCASLLFASMLCACSDVLDGACGSLGGGKVLHVYAKPATLTRVSEWESAWFNDADSTWRMSYSENWNSGDRIALITSDGSTYYYTNTGGDEFTAEGDPLPSSAGSVVGVYPADSYNTYAGPGHISIPSLNDMIGGEPRVGSGYVDEYNNCVSLGFRHILSKISLHAYSDSTTTALVTPYTFSSMAADYNVESDRFEFFGGYDEHLEMRQNTSSYVTRDSLLRPCLTYETMALPGTSKIGYTMYGIFDCVKEFPNSESLVAGFYYDINVKTPRSPELSYDFEYGTADLNIYLPENATFPEEYQYGIDIIYHDNNGEQERWSRDISASDVNGDRLFYYVPLRCKKVYSEGYSFEIYRTNGSGSKEVVYKSGNLGDINGEARRLIGQWNITETGKNGDGSDFLYSYNGDIFNDAGGGASLTSIRELPNAYTPVWLDGYMITMMNVSGSYDADGEQYAYVWKGKTNSTYNPTRAKGTVTYYKKSDGKWTKEFVHDFVMTKD